MAGGDEIKLFHFIQKIYQDIGIHPSRRSNEDISRINPKKWLMLFCLVQFFITSAAYTAMEANSMIEYGITFFSCATVVASVIIYLTLFGQMENTSNYIGNCERFVQQSAYDLITISSWMARCGRNITFSMRLLTILYVAGTHSTMLYGDTNKKIERFTQYFGYVVVVDTTILVLPSLLYTIVNYYFLDSRTESFLLFSPTWFVFILKWWISIDKDQKREKISHLCVQKVAIRFENPVGILSGMDWSVCRIYKHRPERSTILRFHFWIQLVIHCDCWRHYNRCGRFQQHRRQAECS